MSGATALTVPADLERWAERILSRAQDQGLSLVTAESCTGGLLAALLTDVEGVSGVFERGFVTYSKPSKCELLCVPEDLADRCGLVSEEVARAMAAGALKQSHGDIALSITGYAGGSKDEEPGLVHLACQRRGRPAAHQRHRFGDIGRAAIRTETLRAALDMLEEAVGG